MTDPATETPAEPSGRDSAIAFLESKGVPTEDDAAATGAGGAESTETPAEPEQTTIELPTMAQIEAKAKERAEEQAKQEALQAPLRALQEQVEQIQKAGPSVPLQALKGNLRETLQTIGIPEEQIKALSEPAKPADPIKAIEALLEAKLAPVLQQLQPPETPQGPTLEAAQEAYSEYVAGAGDRFPRQSALPASARAAVAWDYVQRMRNAGYDTRQFTDEQIATAVEREMTPAGATSTDEPSGGQEATGATGNPSEPRSITNGHAADGVRKQPMTMKERRQDAIAALEARWAARKKS